MSLAHCMPHAYTDFPLKETSLSLTDQTLHDFVLNLLTDESARSAFSADPTAALAGAGLNDVTAQDVQEVIPLVADYADVAQLPGTDMARADLPADVSADGAEGAIQQLQALAEVGAAQSAPELGEFSYAGGGSADDVTGTFGYAGEQFNGAGSFVAGSEGVAGVGGFDSDLGNGTVFGAGTLDDGMTLGGSLGTDESSREASVSVGPDGVAFDQGEGTGLGAFDFTGSGSAHGVAGGGTFENDEFASEGTLGAGVDGVTAAFGSESELGEFASFTAASTEGVAGGAAFAGEHFAFEGSGAGNEQEFAAGGSTESVLGAYGLETAGVPATPELGGITERSDALDTDALGRGGEAAGGTLATYVSSSGQAFAGSLPAMGAPAAPELPAEIPAELPEAGLPADLPAAVPTAPELPTELPEAGRQTDLPTESSTIPELSEADLSDLPVDVPVELPELPVANPLPEAGDVREDVEQGVSQSPLGDVVSESPVAELPGADTLSGDASGEASGELHIG
jgi:hypothetical protein